MVKLRLTRFGRKKRPFYRIIAIDSRKRRDGAYLEKFGLYDPIGTTDTKLIVDHESALKWLLAGAQPSETVFNLFRTEGILLKFDMLKRFKIEKNGTKDIFSKDKETGKKVKKTIDRYNVVLDENKNPVRLYSDEQVEEAFQNWKKAKETKKADAKKPKKLSKKAKAKLEEEKKGE